MSNSLLTLGAFSFEGLESPQRVHLKKKQRLAVHHLGSGVSITDWLGEECEIVSFRGIFSGTNAADRIRSLDHLRLQGTPLSLTWGSKSLSVIIQEFELDYSSDLWVPYRLSCYVVRSSTDAASEVMTDIISASPITQVNDTLRLLQNTSISPTPGQTSAISELAKLNYDIPSPDALGQTQELVGLIDNQLEILGGMSQDGILVGRGLSRGETFWLADIVNNLGMQISLILARNRVKNILVCAESINQQ